MTLIPDIAQHGMFLMNFFFHVEGGYSVREGKSQPVERQVRLRNFRSESYKLVDDLVVSLEEQSDYVAARSYDTSQYAYGPSADDAIGNLCSTIEEYYELLREERDNLSRPLAAHLRYLDAVLEKI